jgi:hypothetical protein
MEGEVDWERNIAVGYNNEPVVRDWVGNNVAIGYSNVTLNPGEKETPKILRTNNYSIFKTVDFNRNKNKKHIQAVIKIIKKENLLHLHPILVNNSMEVIDGQHRLEAAKELGLEIFYIQSDLSYEHILSSNLIQKNASLNDVIKFYALKDAIPCYVFLYDCLLSLNLSAKGLIGLIFGSCLPALMIQIKEGKFQLPRDVITLNRFIEIYKNFIEFAKSKRITPYSMFSNSNFTIAFRNLILIDNFNEKTFTNKLEMRWFGLKPQMNSREWTKQLVSIYNWKNHNPLEI